MGRETEVGRQSSSGIGAGYVASITIGSMTAPHYRLLSLLIISFVWPNTPGGKQRYANYWRQQFEKRFG